MVLRTRATLTSAIAIAGVAMTFAIGPAAAQTAAAAKPAAASSKSIEHGRYLTKIAGCNDCHTAGYMAAAGKVPEKDWMLGDQFGWRGPWGTTYAINLRLYMASMTEDEWLKKARTMEARPPMPWFSIREMKTEDLRDIYRYIRHLGPAGSPAPAWVPPDKEPKPPYAQFPSPPK